MGRVGFTLGVLLVVFSAFVADWANASGISGTQGEAYAACLKVASGRYKPGPCRFRAGTGQPILSLPCSASGMATGVDVYDEIDGTSGSPTGQSFGWCVPPDCSVYDSGSADQQWSAPYKNGDIQCSNSCLSRFVSGGGGISSVEFPDGSGGAWGHWKGSGERCGSEIDAGLFKVVPQVPVCDPGKISCYNPKKGWCYGTQSGESVCLQTGEGPGGAPSGCKGGATGAVCASTSDDPKPNPSDPPIPKDQPPDSTVKATTRDGTGGSANITINNYSGTSTGGTGPESGAPGESGPGGSPGGTGSNANGSGNSGPKGTDTNGRCPDGKVPTASGCSGTYTDLGCDSPPLCYGDAVLCGVAVNTHRSACNPASGSSIGTAPDQGDPLDGSGDPLASSVVGEYDLGDGSNLDRSGFGFSAACPLRDVTFTVMGKQVVIPLEDKCDLLGFLRYIVLGLALFASAKIIAGVNT